MFVLIIVENLDRVDPDCDIHILGCSEDKKMLIPLFQNYIKNLEKELSEQGLYDEAVRISDELLEHGDYRGPENTMGLEGWSVVQIKTI